MSSAESISRVAAEVLGLLIAQNRTIACAESLTGGLCADAFVSLPGSSQAFVGGVVAYATDLKHLLLSVDAALLARNGPVDGDVARQMAVGVRRLCAGASEVTHSSPMSPGKEHAVLRRDYAACIGLATTGVAGPAPDEQSGQEPGTVWIAVSSHSSVHATQFSFQGTRNDVRLQSVEAALRLTRELLLGEAKAPRRS